MKERVAPRAFNKPPTSEFCLKNVWYIKTGHNTSVIKNIHLLSLN